MIKQRPPSTPSSPKNRAKEGKVLRRAIDRSEVKDPPTVGKPVIEEPVVDQTPKDHHATA